MLKFLLSVCVATLLQPMLSHAQMGSANTSSASEGDYIRLVAALDEPEFYCIDLTGWGQSLVLDDPLQAHTCKLNGSTDQMFAVDGDHIKVSGYDRCLQVAGSSNKALPGSALLVRKCNDESPLQKIALTDNGKLVLQNTEYCLAAGTDTENASGPSHVWRTLTAEKCDNTDSELTTWQLGLK